MSVGVLSFTLQAVGAGAILQNMGRVVSAMKGWEEAGKRVAELSLKRSAIHKESAIKAALDGANLRKSIEDQKKELDKLMRPLKEAREEYKHLGEEIARTLKAQAQFQEKHSAKDIEASPALKAEQQERMAMLARMQQERSNTGDEAAKKGAQAEGLSLGIGGQQKDAKLAGLKEGLHGIGSAVMKGVSGLTKFASALGGVVTALAAVAVYGVRVGSENRKMAGTLGQASKSSDELTASIIETRQASLWMKRSFDEAGESLKHYNALLKNAGVDMRDFVETASRLKTTRPGQSIDEISDALARYIATGDTVALESIQGMDVTKLKGKTGTAEQRQTAVSDFSQISDGAAEEQRKGGIGQGVSTIWRKTDEFATHWSNSLKMAMGKLDEAVAKVNPEVRAKLDAENALEKDRRKETNVTAGLKQLDAAHKSLKEQRTVAGQLADQWTDIVSRQHQLETSLNNTVTAITEVAFRSNQYQTSAERATLAFKQGIAFTKGTIRDPGKAMQGFTAGAQQTTGVGMDLKSINQQLTGVDEYGTYTGNRATGRSAYVLREKQRHMREAEGASLMERGRELGGATGERLSALGAQISSENDPEQLQDAIMEAAKIQADLAKEQASKMQHTLELQSVALTATIPRLLTAIYEAQKGADKAKALPGFDEDVKETIRKRKGLEHMAQAEAESAFVDERFARGPSYVAPAAPAAERTSSDSPVPTGGGSGNSDVVEAINAMAGAVVAAVGERAPTDYR